MSDPTENSPPAVAVADAPPNAPVVLVGIGASAGGLEALERLFAALPPPDACAAALAFVVVQHLSPDHKSLMVELLARHTRFAVRPAEDGHVIEPGSVYVLQPRKAIRLSEGRLVLDDRGASHGLPLPIDTFFLSLAEGVGARSIAVVLSGTGSDGARGANAVKEAGGAVFVQSPETARFDGMPRAAIAMGIADRVLPPEELAGEIVRWAGTLSRGETLPIAGPLDDNPDTLDRMMAIIGAVRRHTTADFAPYKRSTIGRRISRRMAMQGLASLAQYAQVVEQSPEEAAALAQDLLISVTRFFRDPDAFEAVARVIVPEVIEATPIGDTIRVWVPGCATGEEAYSIGMLFLEALESNRRSVDVKIFATDVNRGAIERASTGLYPEGIAGDVSTERLSRFFERFGDGFRVSSNLRRRVVFATHDVMRDPPFLRVDLLSCRNMLIYFDPEPQRRILDTFHFALRPQGFLFLGTSDSVTDMTDSLTPVDVRARIFRSTGYGPTQRVGVPLPPRARPTGRRAVAETVVDAGHRQLLSHYAPPAFLVSETMELLHVYGEAGQFLSVPAGAATLNFGELVPRGARGLVSNAVHHVFRERSEMAYRDITWETRNGPMVVTLRVLPVEERAEGRRSALVVLETALPRSNEPMSTVEAGVEIEKRMSGLEEELKFTKESLQAMIEELETSNEELQATNEELLASNEELQSANEELQSVNEELHTVNSEHQSKIGELAALNEDVDNLLRATDVGTLFLDEDLRIRRFTPAITSIVPVLSRDVGRPITHLSTLLAGVDLEQVSLGVLQTGRAAEREVSLASGRHVLLRARAFITEAGERRGVVITLVDVTLIHEARVRLQAVLDSLQEHIAVVDAQGMITMVNRAWRTFSEANGGGDYMGTNYLDVCRNVHGLEQPAALAVAAGLDDVLNGRAERFVFEYPCHSPIAKRWYLLHARALANGEGAVVSHLNITERVLADQEAAGADAGGELP
ncbi:PAS domain-containing protein [Myxococcota bacterium]|nr:PAS domain-containing protein [Myxococcota bacterium]